MMALKILFGEILGLLAPLVTIFYKKGWFATPDDPVSPYGMYEERMRYLYAHLPAWLCDWYWLGIRNRAYGYAYDMKPDNLKGLTSYKDFADKISETDDGKKRVITLEVDGKQYKEYMYRLSFLHLIVGYRLRPIRDSIKNEDPVKPINMDGRPIFSIRAGKNDD